MKTTVTLSQNLHCSPFEIFDRECDEVIMLINFYIELGDSDNSKKSEVRQSKEDGFWDF